MGSTAKNIAERYIGAAKQNPDAREEIFRVAATTFMGLAMDPKNASSSQQLAKYGMDFATAAAAARPATMSDFTDILNETRQAYEETGEDPMGAIARAREVHDQNTKVTPGFTSIAPESFNKDATLGRSAVIKWAPTNDDIANGIVQQQTVAFWQGNKKEAQAMTVDVSLGFLPTLNLVDATPSGQNARPYAEVEFGSDGNRNKVQFDVALGKRCTVVGNYISVTVGMDANIGTLPSPQLTVGASIGTFAAPSQAPLIRTIYTDVAAGVVGDFVAIPVKAALLLPPQSIMALGDTAELRFYDYGGSLVSRVPYQQMANLAMQPIPITGDVSFVAVWNQTGSDRTFRLPFQLAL